MLLNELFKEDQAKIDELRFGVLSPFQKSATGGREQSVIANAFPQFANFFARSTSPKAFKYVLDKYKDGIDNNQHIGGSATEGGRHSKFNVLFHILNSISRKHGLEPRPTMNYINKLVDVGELDSKYKFESKDVVEYGIITKQNVTPDVKLGDEYKNVKALGIGSGKKKLPQAHKTAAGNTSPNKAYNLGIGQ